MSALAQPISTAPNESAGALRLRLRCPQCGAELGSLLEEGPEEFSPCSCGFHIRNQNGIWEALPPSQVARFARFMLEYQTVREAEKRGSQTADYYLALPYRDVSGHNQGQWAIRSQTYAYLERRILPGQRRRGSSRLRVLDLGAGNGWMSYRLSLAGYEPVAVDLFTTDMDGLGGAVHYKCVLPNLFPRFQSDLGHLPFADDQFDVAIFNASFHYSQDYGETLREAMRCLRSHGTLIIADTPWYSRDESGKTMVRERQQYFTKLYGFPSDALASLEYLTDERLDELSSALGLRWRIYSPFYGMRWAMRPLMAKLKRKREPSRFRIYVAEVTK